MTAEAINPWPPQGAATPVLTRTSTSTGTHEDYPGSQTVKECVVCVRVCIRISITVSIRTVTNKQVLCFYPLWSNSPFRSVVAVSVNWGLGMLNREFQKQ